MALGLILLSGDFSLVGVEAIRPVPNSCSGTASTWRKRWPAIYRATSTSSPWHSSARRLALQEAAAVLAAEAPGDTNAILDVIAPRFKDLTL